MIAAASSSSVQQQQKESIIHVNHYANTNIHPFTESKDIKLPALYHQTQKQNLVEVEGGSALEEDTDEDDDDKDLLPSVISTFNEIKQPTKKSTPLMDHAAASAVSAIKVVQPLSSHSVSILPPIQTYSPQLNLSLYSPSITTPISSIRSSSNNKKNRDYTSNSDTILSSSSSAAPCLQHTSIAVQNTTIYKSKEKSKLSASPSIASSIIKMDIRSPPQPSQSISRFMNAFHRFSRANHYNSKVHQNLPTLNSVAPAEIVSSIKPSPSKSSLADKIKSKFHQQLDKKKRSSLMDSSTTSNALNNSNIIDTKSTFAKEKSSFSMPTSASLQSITNWTSRKSNKTVAPALPAHGKSLISVTKLSHSLSVRSCSSTSSSEEPGVTTAITPQLPSLSLTKSISSHRLYHKDSTTARTDVLPRPRQPLRAINPTDSIRLKKSKKKSGVRFIKSVSVRETYSKVDYDRGSDPEAICTRLTPTMAQQIKEELNAYKLHEMQVHQYSRVHTHFFL